MLLTKDENIQTSIQKMVTEGWGHKVRENVALTDTLQPRKAYMDRVFPEAPTQLEVLYFLSGKAIEKGLGDLIQLPHPIARKVNGIWYNPDFRIPYEDTEAPIELKSRRANLPKAGTELDKFSNYVDQLFGYCTLDDVDVGFLIVLSLSERVDDTRKTQPVLVGYKFTCTKEEREAYMNILVERKNLLEQALESNEWHILPMCEEWKCKRTITNMLSQPVCSCGKEFKNDFLLNKHLGSAKVITDAQNGNSHTGTFSVKEHINEPRCRHYERCFGNP